MGGKLDSNYTRKLRAVLYKSWRQHPTKQQLYSHLPPITKTIQVRRTRHAGHSWRSKDELISDILLWTPLHGRTKAEWPARTYVQLLCADTGCSLEDLPGAMDDRDGWWERFRGVRVGGATWWWWWWWWHITHSSVTIAWLALLSHKKFDDNCLSLEQSTLFSTILNSLKANILRS